MAASASPDDIDIVSAWTTLKRSLPKILIASMLAGGLTYGVLSTMAPRYSSEAQLQIVEKGAAADPYRDPRRDGVGSDAVVVRMDKEAINTHVRALLSADLAEKVVTELKLDKKPEFNSAAGSPDLWSKILRMAGIGGPKKSESDLSRALATYMRQLEVYSPKESRSIVIQFTSIDSELAKTVANLVGETYREALAAKSTASSTVVEDDLTPKIAELREEVAESEAEVDRFRGEINIFKSSSGGTDVDQQLNELTGELTKARAARSEVESRAKSAREMLKSGSAEVLPDVQKSPLIQGLVQQRVRLEREIAEASASLLPGHPRMRQLTAELAGLKKQVNGEVAKVVDSLDKEAKSAVLREESIDKSLAEIKKRVVTAAPDEGKLRNLEATAKAKREELASMEAKLEAARTGKASRAVPVAAEIIEQARASSIPVYPKKAFASLLAGFSVLLLGMALSITGALLRGARRPATAPATGTYPTSPKSSARPELSLEAAAPVAKTAGGANGERMMRVSSITALAVHLEEHSPGTGGCRTLVVGETNAIDAGTEAVQLAKELAGRGHATILVDWNPDGSALAPKLGLQRTPGMTELLAGAAKFEDVVQRLPDSEAHVIAAGTAQPYSHDGPNPDQLNLVLDALDEAYAHIVVVGPHEAARTLFEVIEGRFDAGVTVSDGKKRVTVIQDPPGTFLGYEVADIELVRFERKDANAAAGQRIVRSGAATAEARA